MIYFSVYRVLVDGSEVLASPLEFKRLQPAIRKANAEANKWRRVILTGRPRKPEQIPTYIVVRERSDENAINFAQYAVDVAPNQRAL